MSSLEEFSSDFPGTEQMQELNIKLVNDNKRLKELVESLKAEQQETLEFAAKNEELMQKNAQLQSKLRNAKAKNGELQQKLEINIKSFEELKKKQAEAKQDTKRINFPDAARIIESEKKKFQLEIEKIKNENQTKEDILRSFQDEKNALRTSLNSILKLSQEAFNTSFENEEKLISFLSERKFQDSASSSQIQEIEQNTAMNELEEKLVRKLAKLKKELKQEKERRKTLENELENSKKNSEEIKKKAESQISEIKDRVSEEKHQLSLNEITLKNEIEKLKSENKRNVEQISFLKENSRKPTDNINNDYKMENDKLREENQKLLVELSCLKNKLQETKQNYSMLKAQNESLVNQIKTTNVREDASKNKISKQQQELQETQTLCEKLKIENKSLLLEVNKLQEEVLSSNLKIKTANISTQQCQTLLDESKNEIEKYQKALESLENNYEKQKNETQEVYLIRDKLINIAQKQTNALKNMENAYEAQISQNKQQKKLNKLLQDKLNEEIKKVVPPAEIPVTAWFNNEFPRELCSKITDFARNDSLDAASKLRNVLGQVSLFYNSQVKELKQECEKSKARLESGERVFEEFLSMLGAVLRINLTIDVLAHDSTASERVKESIIKLQNEQDGTIKEKQTIETSLSDLVAKLEVQNVDEAKDMIGKLYQRIETLTRELSVEKSMVSKAKKLVKAIDAQSSERIEELEKQIDDYEEEIKAMIGASNENTNKQKELEKELEAVKESKIEQEDRNKELLEAQRSEYEQKIMNIRSSHEQEVQRLKAAIERRGRENETQKERIEQLLDQIEQWKHSSHSFDLIKKQTEEQMRSLIAQFEETEEEMKAANMKEKKALIEQYESCINDVKKNNKEIQLSQEETANALLESNRKVQELNAKLAASEKECIDLNNKLRSKSDAIERERSIIEMKARSSLLSQEMKYQNIIDENKQKYETEKRRIVEFTADLFSDFFDAKMELDSFCYKSILTSVSNELVQLKKQESSLRSLLCINENASICKTVAKLLLSIYQPEADN